jgi:hypothetical protein
MTVRLRAGAAVFALAISSPAFAQESAAPQAAPAAAAAPADTAAPAASAPADAVAPAANIVPQGTEIMFKTVTPLTSKESRVGDRVMLEVSEDVRVGDYIVIPVGAPAVGHVTFVKKKGGWGKPGKLDATVDSVKVDGVDVAVHGTVGDKGKKGGAAVVGAVLFSPLIVAPFVGFFVTGKSAVVEVGTPTAGTLDQDLAFDPARTPRTQAPVVAAVASPPAETAAVAAPQ